LLAQPPLPESVDARRTLRTLEADLARAHAEANAGRFDAARTRYQHVVAGAAQLRWAPLEAQAHMSIGELELKLGRNKAGDDALANAIDAASRAKDDRLVADTLIKMLVAVMVTTVQTSEAERMIRLADAAVTRAGDDPFLRAEFHAAAGHMLYLRHDRVHGAEHYERAIVIYERLPGDFSDPIARLRTARAAEAIDDNNLPRAVEELAKARAAIGEPLGDSTTASNYLNTSCMAQMFLQQHEQALAECTRARDLFAAR
jgi:tetratricopeptide (TPR) repeat protein